MTEKPDKEIQIQDLLAFRESRRRLLGFDLGDKTIGLSLSDGSWLIASPLELISRTSFSNDFQRLKKIVADYGVCALVCGLPLNMNGSEGPQAVKVRSFMDKLAASLKLPVLYWDERLSTVAVTRTLLDADMSRARRADVVDKMAATFILQGVLDRLRNLKDPESR